MDPRLEHVVRQMAQSQEAMFRYIFALLPHEEDAREALQEACVALLQKYRDYDPARPFLPWACRFARLKAFKQREKRDRDRHGLGLAVLNVLGKEWEERSDELFLQLRALDVCLDLLPPVDRDLVRCRYQGKSRMDELVRQFGGSERTIFRNLDRIRRRLFDCITRRMAAAGDD